MATREQQETLSFQAEVKQLLHLVTHALYSNKEIFLRELISNASDAADKLRFEALGDAALFETDPELKIWVSFDKEKRTITVRDNGIGMNREEVIENLGTIAKSGTREFLTKLSGDQAKDSNMIGQFGVGFYSGFVVADQVIVKTRRAGMTPDQGVYWESTGGGDYIIKNIERNERGTEVILHLRTEEDEFLDDWRLRGIITKYSDHILLPIVMEKPSVPTGEEEKKLNQPNRRLKLSIALRHYGRCPSRKLKMKTTGNFTNISRTILKNPCFGRTTGLKVNWNISVCSLYLAALPLTYGIVNVNMA